MTSPEKLAFNITLQFKILAAALREHSCAVLLKDIIDPKHFEDEILIEVADVAKHYMLRYNRVPTKEALMGILEERKKGDVEDYAPLLEKLFTMKLDDARYMRDKLLTFAKRQAMYAAIVRAVDNVNNGDFESVSKDVKRALCIGESMSEIGEMLVADVHDRVKRRKSQQYIIEKVPTLVVKLDEILGGGLGVGELGVVLGFLNIGKSILLGHMGKAALMMGKKVVHYSLEMSKDAILERYEASITGIEKNSIKEHGDIILDKFGKFTGEVLVKKYPTRGASVDTLRSHLDIVQSNLFKPNLIVVDYGDIMRSPYKHESEYESQKVIFEELRSLAEEAGCPLWTGTQATRGALNKEIVTVDDMADSIAKARVADVVLAMCMTEEEKAMNRLRLFMAKNRDNISGNVVHCIMDRAKMQVSIDSSRYTTK